MLIKSLVLGACLVSTPLCLVSDQEPARGGQKATTPTATDPAPAQEPAPGRAQQLEERRRVQRELESARRDLQRTRQELQEMERQLGEVLDTLDATFEPQRDRDCSPSRNRSLMSHYQWLDRNDHQERADKALARIVEQAGNDVHRLNGLAWDLMTDKQTLGQFDRIALAIAERMEQQGRRLGAREMDTIALARFLNGDVARAIATQEQAIARGGSSDDYRRRLRTYQAAQVAIAKAGDTTPPPATTQPANQPANRLTGTTVAANDDED